jgi:hypothetical protein
MTRRKQYPLRVDPEIWAAVERWAEDDMRSANAQVEWILRDSLRRAGRLPDRDVARTTKAAPPRARRASVPAGGGTQGRL